MSMTVSVFRPKQLRATAIVIGIALLGASSATASSSGVVARAARPLSSSICSKVSPASVSALIGYSVPAATVDIRKLKATKQSYGISAVLTTCTFGAQTSLAALTKDVTLTLEVTSRPFTTSEFRQALSKVATATLKVKVAPYSGLGVPALYITTRGGGISGEGIYGIAGTRVFGATVFKPLSKSKLASLAKLAQSL